MGCSDGPRLIIWLNWGKRPGLRKPFWHDFLPVQYMWHFLKR